MASIKDKRGEVSWQVGRSCSTQILLSTTRSMPPNLFKSLITTREFQHSWGQNSIVIFALFVVCNYAPISWYRLSESMALPPTDNSVVIVGAHLDRCANLVASLLYKWLIHCSSVVRICGHSYQRQVICLYVHAPDYPTNNLKGPDDDGSGSMSILESYRALLAADFHPVRAVEFQWVFSWGCRL